MSPPGNSSRTMMMEERHSPCITGLQPQRLWMGSGTGGRRGKASIESGDLRRVDLYRRHTCGSLPSCARDSEGTIVLRNMGCHDMGPFVLTDWKGKKK